MRSRGKLAAVGFVGAAIALATTSVAFACVQVVGRLSVTGTNGGVSVADGNGTHPPFNMYCESPTVGASAPNPTGFADKPTVNISYGASPVCPTVVPVDDPRVEAVRPGRANAPRNGTYDVMYCPDKAFQRKGGSWEFKVFPDRGSCFFTDAVTDRAVLMGTMTVAGGSGSAALKIPFGGASSGPNNAAAISVRMTSMSSDNPSPPAGFTSWGPPDVNIAPITIL